MIPYTKFEHFRVIRFGVMLRTNRQTNKQTNKQTDSKIGVGNNDWDVDCGEIGWMAGSFDVTDTSYGRISCTFSANTKRMLKSISVV